MVLAFKNQFVQPILEGTKIHTIREDKFNRWKPGYLINMATGVRTPNYKEFKKCVCVSTQEIEFTIDSCIIIDNRTLYWNDLLRLSFNDGFETFDDFYDFFELPFKGKIIHWTSFKY